MKQGNKTTIILSGICFVLSLIASIIVISEGMESITDYCYIVIMLCAAFTLVLELIKLKKSN